MIGPGCPRTLASPALGLTRVPTKGKWLEQHGALKVSMKIWTGDPGQCSGNSTRLFPTTGLSFSSQQHVGQREADKINWTEIAVSLNRPLDGGYLKMICKRTSWRRALGRTVRQVPHFTASDHRGHAIGRLGTDLVPSL